MPPRKGRTPRVSPEEREIIAREIIAARAKGELWKSLSWRYQYSTVRLWQFMCASLNTRRLTDIPPPPDDER